EQYQNQLIHTLQIHALQQRYTRQQQLTWYLNTADYGNFAFGIDAAAQIYFDQTASDLTLAQAATLAAISAGRLTDPYANPDLTRIQREYILIGLTQAGVINNETYLDAKFAPLGLVPLPPSTALPIAPHFSQQVQNELIERYGVRPLLEQGWRVYTSLDLPLQQQAECVMNTHLRRLQAVGSGAPAVDEIASCPALAHLPPLPPADIGRDHQVTNGALLALDPTNGTILALIGNLDPDPDSPNIPFDQPRQPGTLWQPLVYLTALSQGYSPATMILDIPTTYTTTAGTTYTPDNADGLFHGPLRLRPALGQGYLAPAVQLINWVGPVNVAQTATNLGIQLPPNEDAFNLTSLAQGSPATLADLSYAYATLANNGQMTGRLDPNTTGEKPTTILRIEDQNGRILYDYTRDEQQTRRILAPELAYLLNDILADANIRCPSPFCNATLNLPDRRPVAVKTGTTTTGQDAWTVGYTPDFLLSIWLGNTDNSPMTGITGLNGPAPIWRAITSWHTHNTPIQLWSRPTTLVERTVCRDSGLLPTEYCPTIRDYFIPGTLPTAFDTIYRPFRINRETGRLATIYTPPELIDTRIYQVYPPEADDWVAAQGIPQPPTDYDTIIPPPRTTDQVAIFTPEPFAYVRDQIDIIGNANIDGFAYYRLAYFAGLDAVDVQILVDQVRAPQQEAVLGTLDVSEMSGLYTLLLTVVGENGRFTEVSTHIVVDNDPPQITLTAPLPEERIAVQRRSFTLSPTIDENTDLSRVEFYQDNDTQPFATRFSPPYTLDWPIPGIGCHTYHARAYDRAGNQASTPPVNVCFVSWAG
ncbi:MAG TPA: transglycosylase domain-containing protein, partial [Anaerolineae bacterium]|nr:transglycosylase domain-containing protein [Anaerolineae bacterium]